MHSLYLPEHNAFVRWHETAGDGPPVICLPGLGLSCAGNFITTMTDPALRDYQAIMIDFPGSGISDTAADFTHSLGEHAAVVARVLDHIGCAPCPVLGYSMGGSVAIELALRRPDLVSRLIIAEGNLFPGGGAASKRIADQTPEAFFADDLPLTLTLLRRAARQGDTVADFIAASWAQADPRALYENAQMLVNLPDDFAARFFSLALPRHYIFGEDTLKAPAGADSPKPTLLAKNGIRTAIIAGVGHEMMIANPRGFAQAVAQALNDTGAADMGTE